MTQTTERRLRMWHWCAITVALMGLVGWLAPHQLEVTLYKLSLVTLAAWIGYWIDRGLFPYARPHVFIEDGGPAGLMMMRRAVIVGCSMLAVSLGL